jgi:hypothetical protein
MFDVERITVLWEIFAVYCIALPSPSKLQSHCAATTFITSFRNGTKNALFTSAPPLRMPVSFSHCLSAEVLHA